MKSKGQVAIFVLMIFIVVIIMALALAPALKGIIDEARAPSSNIQIGLDCSNDSISDFDKANCVAVDLYQPYFIGFLIAMGGAIIGARIYYA